MQNRFKFRFWDSKRNIMLYPDENNEYLVDDSKVDLGKMLKSSGKLNSRFKPMQNIGLTKCDLYEQDVVEVIIAGEKITGLLTSYNNLPYYFYLVVDGIGGDWRALSDWIYDGYIIGNFYEGKYKEKVKIHNE